MKNSLITDKVANNILAQMKALDAMAEERERLKRETMDGCRLFKGLEVYSADDPFYPAVVVDPKRHAQMAMVKCRQVNDRRKKYSTNVYDRFIFVDQFKAFTEALNKHDEMSKELVCNINDADRIKAERAEMRLEILDGMAMCINKKNPTGAHFRMKSKRFKKGSR